MWLCAARPDELDPDIPRWASTLIAEYSAPGQRLEVRAGATYPGLPGEVSALLAAGAAAGRDAIGVLPTPGLAARTRALLPAFTTPDPSRPDPSCWDGEPRTWAGPRPRVLVDRRDAPRTAAAGLMVVLAGPVRAGATTARTRPPRRAGIATVLAEWVRGLAVGGTLVLLSPPPPGHSDPADRHHARGSGSITEWVREWVEAAQAAGLAYTQHIVLVHLPVADDAFLPSQPYEGRSAPFHPAHTDAFVFSCTRGAPPGTGVAAERAARDGEAVAGE